MSAARGVVTADDVYLMGAGRWNESYRKLGAHLCEVDGVAGCRFDRWIRRSASNETLTCGFTPIHTLKRNSTTSPSAIT